VTARRRPLRLLGVAAVAVALALAGLAVNLLLLGYADSRDDPVGTLTPRATLTGTASAPPTSSGRPREHEDDDGERDD
jgi:hypothetical protein